MQCAGCELLNCLKLLIKNQYCIVNDNDTLKCVLNEHSKEPKGCKSCVKSYMKQDLFLFAQKFYEHSRFTIQEVSGDHLYYEVVMGVK
jgi:hypothetical protein